MIFFFALVTLKTVRLLIETAKHVDVSSYERLAEVSFGKRGFVAISLAMFVMSYGAMVGYMMIVKNNLSYLLGVSDDNVYVQRAVLVISSLIIMLPLSMNRDMSALSKTSSISVIFDGILVGIVAFYSPFGSSVDEAGGLLEVIQTSQPDIGTFFIGIGVLCFAFVCQHSAFIIAASLENPTRQRWNAVTGIALSVCAVLASVMGVTGFLGFLEDTDGDILINLGRAASVGNDAMQTASNLARGLLCTTMFFVYPMELFVARHVCVVLFFKGRRAHEGDDHSVLSRRDRRVAITLALYIISLAPALLFTDLGSVFSVTGSLGGAILSYIGPGITFIAVHGDEFLMLASYRWSHVRVPGTENTTSQETKPTSVLNRDEEANTSESIKPSTVKEKHCIVRIYDDICWYIYLMPIWCKIASHGKKMLKEHREAEALKSPFPMALGRIIHQNPMKHRVHDIIKPSTMMNGRNIDHWYDRIRFKNIMGGN
jgi:sodium-coupled neutral amino acid transporter 11